MGYNEDIEALTTKLENTLISYHSLESDQWRVAKMTKDVTVWRRPSEEFHGYLYKTEGLVKDSPSRIIDFIRPGPCRLRWDSLMTSMDIVNTIDQSRCVMRYTTAGQLWGLISPREFVDLSFTTSYKTGLLSCGVSVDDLSVGECPGAVRGFNHPCGWFCVPACEEDGSLLTGYVQTELRGKIPQSAVDAAMGNTLVNFYTDLNKVLRE